MQCRTIKLLRVALFGLACGIVGSTEDAQARNGAARATTAAHATSSSSRYYVEFRAAQIGTYGHSYVAYGRLDARGQLRERRYADLHPMGGYIVMALGHVLPVPGNTAWDDDVLRLPVTSAYRRSLNATEYQKVVDAIRRLQSSRPSWNALTYNCNHFVAEIAQAAGLRTPSNLLISYLFIPALRDLNEPPAR